VALLSEEASKTMRLDYRRSNSVPVGGSSTATVSASKKGVQAAEQDCQHDDGQQGDHNKGDRHSIKRHSIKRFPIEVDTH
jgi:hypothetical protein